MLYFAEGHRDKAFSHDEIKEAIYSVLGKIGIKEKVLVVPPDITRFYSRAGEVTRYLYDYYGESLKDVLPALGTHFEMTPEEISKMYEGVPQTLFRYHDWRNDVVTVGEVPASFVKEVSEGAVDYSWPAQVNKMLVEGGHDLIVSVGQVVPHEVIGMANYNKNIFVGVGGSECISKSHFIGAAYGMERIMGRVDNPVRKVLNYASEHFTPHLPILYILTVVSQGEDGLQMRGLYIGDDVECFERAAELSLEVNFTMLDREIKKAVVYLDPQEFKTTWVSNKSIYRTRMAIADGGELIVMAPGLKQFGEDPEIDKMIRKYGYLTSKEVLETMKVDADLASNEAVAAHLIHGSSEGRFQIKYCPKKMSREEIEGVGFAYGDLDEMMNKYDITTLKDGWNIVDGEEIYYISNPALGLWAYKEKFKN